MQFLYTSLWRERNSSELLASGVSHRERCKQVLKAEEWIFCGQACSVHLLLGIRHDVLQVDTPHLDLFLWGLPEVWGFGS